ncbi:serine/threonine protein kinase [Desulfonema ishimotonii]|uniref:Serine/threonine protein kinase n=1 Tax=Desulfonema ishimotonii TaxID=45657 RepID=A0A401FXL4_9BACT|nr:protein kinase [Desulfonema ishimotonii]GBC61710.1 serine/threonine protein kinase [Desulfonema ishimotonii]
MKKIGRYIVRGQLGRGGMGYVYKVEMPVTGKIVALKLLKPNDLLVRLMGMEKIREMFVAEAVTMSDLRHPNLVEIWDFDEDRGMPFYVMDYYCNNLGTMIGETYETEKPSRVIRVDKAVRYTRQILAGLSRLHHGGIIHRDIKPFNMLVTDQDTVRICDFGLSKLRGERFSGPSNLKVGTPWYAPPEQERDPDSVDFNADLFSVGVMLCRMLTGVLPMEQPKAPSRLNPDLNEAWDAFLLKAISPQPSGRFQCAAEMDRELATLYGEWEKQKENICNLPAEMIEDTPTAPPLKERLRRESIRVRPGEARQAFGLDELWRPARYVQNRFDAGGGTVTDQSTGLTWEQAGSAYPVTWTQARTHIEELSRRRFGGRSDWRLPTVHELMSLLNRTPHGQDLCIGPVFDATRKWLWSCDRRSFIAAWYVSLELGFVGWQDFSGYYYARGVCG